MTFNEIGVPTPLIEALMAQEITAPTPIQQDTYPLIVAGKDVIGRSHTGSGKTLAYLLPILANIDIQSQCVQAIVLVPTQELGIQVLRQIQLLSDRANLQVRSCQLIGEGNINRQIESIKSKPHIIVGTSGRIVKLLKMKKLSVHQVKTLVADEADKLLAKDNIDGFEQVRKAVMKYTQVLMFSASMDAKSIDIAKKYVNEPQFIDIKNEAGIPETIRHMYVISERREKVDTLRKAIAAIKPKKCLIFANTAYDLEETLEKLKYHQCKVESLYGSDDKNSRKRAVSDFRSGKLKFLISTDLASRGLQIDNIDVVVNVGLPEDSKEYQHRVGRCGRNGKKGTVISIITENELPKIKSLQKEFGINIIQRKLYEGKLVRG